MKEILKATYRIYKKKKKIKQEDSKLLNFTQSVRSTSQFGLPVKLYYL